MSLSSSDLSRESIEGDATAFQQDEGGSSPTSRLFRKKDWWVRPCLLDTARDLVERYHYAAGASNTAVFVHGLYPVDALWEIDCVGVAWWLPPINSAARAVYPQNWKGVLSLSRLVIVPDVPKNACSFLIRHSMRQINRKRWPFLLTFADDFQNHLGTIYKAAGWKESGRTKKEKTYRLNGRIISRKSGPKTRTHKQMLELGCEYLGEFAKTRFVHVLK